MKLVGFVTAWSNPTNRPRDHFLHWNAQAKG
jgi:hypothetical protein